IGNYVEVPKLRLNGLNEFTIDTRIRWGGRKEKGTIVVGLSDPLFAVDVENAGSIVPYLLRGRQDAHILGGRLPDTACRDVAVTVSASQVEVFIDGQQQVPSSPPPTTIPADWTPPRDAFMIGAGLAWDRPVIIYPFLGEIAELRVSRTVRYRGNYTPSARW